MQIQMNPANTAHPRDFNNYVREFRASPPARQEIKARLNQMDSARYPTNAPNSKFETFEAFEDFVLGVKHLTVADKRLGGDLGPAISPDKLKERRKALKPKTKNFSFSTGHTGTIEEAEVVVRADGAILHDPNDVPDPKSREAAHHYMHHCFDHILYCTRAYLDAVNDALVAYSNNTTNAQSRIDYEEAIRHFEKFVAELQPDIVTGHGPFNWVTVSPVVTNEGFIVSARIEVNWKNPYHSSSTVRVP